MSDTPRTDAACNIYDLQIVAEDIERELNAANAIIRQQQLLHEENLRLQDRIKQLEEAGDSMYFNNEDNDDSRAWLREREAK